MSQKLNSEPIDKKVAQAMVNAYTEEARNFPKSYTKAVWFPAEQILEMAKSMSEGKYDGLRIYFGQYTPDSLEGLPKTYEGRNTLLLVPTLPSISNDDEHRDDLDDIENRGEMCPEVCNGTCL